MFAFASDLRNEGVETVLDNVVERAGLGGVALAAAHHYGRDVFPHNPARKVSSGLRALTPGQAWTVFLQNYTLGEAHPTAPAAMPSATST